jgi:hypothetical protein
MIDAVGIREEVFMYQSAAPALGYEGAMCAYAEVVARERTVQEYGHERMLQAAQEGIAPDMTLEAFLLETASDPDARAAYTARLHENGVKVKLKGYKQLMPTLQ